MAARQPAPKKIRAPREDVVKSASISIDGKDQTLSCTIRDISTTGAKISVANAATVNPRVLLLCRGADLVALADIVWRSSHEIGVHFIRRGGFHLEAEFRARQAETYHSQQESAGAQQQQTKTQTAC